MRQLILIALLFFCVKSFSSGFERRVSISGNTLFRGADASYFTSGFDGQSKSDNPLNLVKYNSDGSEDKTFSFKKIPFFTKSITFAWHRLSQPFLILRDEKFISTTLSGSNSTNTFRYSHLRKMDIWGNLDQNFGKSGIVKFEKIDSGLNYRYVSTLIEQNDGMIIGAEKRCVPEGNSHFGDCELYLFRLNKKGSLDSKFGKNGYALIGPVNIDLVINTYLENDEIYVLKFMSRSLYDGGSLHISKLSKNGILDNNFGDEGSKNIAAPKNCTLDSAQFISNYIITTYGCHSSRTFEVVKYDLNGRLDEKFGENGFFTLPIEFKGNDWYEYKMPSRAVKLSTANFVVITPITAPSAHPCSTCRLHQIHVTQITPEGRLGEWGSAKHTMSDNENIARYYHHGPLPTSIDLKNRVTIELPEYKSLVTTPM